MLLNKQRDFCSYPPIKHQGMESRHDHRLKYYHVAGRHFASILIWLSFSILFSQDSTHTISGDILALSTSPLGGIGVFAECNDFDVYFTTETGQTINGEVSSCGFEGQLCYTIEIISLTLSPSVILPNEISISQNYPNPFNPATRLCAYISNKGTFKIFDILGREIQSANLSFPGEYELTWGGANKAGKSSPAGVYIYRLSGGESVRTGKMTLLDGGNTSGLTARYTGNNKRQVHAKTKTANMMNGTLCLTASCITNIDLPVSVSQDTTIHFICNVAPNGVDQSYSVHIGDTLTIDLNEVIINDSPTIFEVEENDYFLPLNEFTLRYIPQQPETFSVEIIGIDSIDTALEDTITLTLESAYSDTTSHEFTWEIDTFGSQMSFLLDVAIVDENDIWAVGTIAIDPPYFVRNAHWDGEEWNFFDVISGAEKITVFAFAHDDIWMTSSLPMHFDGNEWHVFTPNDDGYPTGAGWLISIWGSSSENMYFGGSYGYIIHYDGETFTALDSPTNDTPIDIERISGSVDGEHVFAIGKGIVDSELHSIILTIENGQIDTLYNNIGVTPTEGNMGALYDDGLDVFGDIAYFSTSAGIWKYNFITGDSTVLLEGESQYLGTEGIEVQSHNDISIFFSRSKFLHYNGVEWVQDNTVMNELPFQNICYGMDFKDNMIISVGGVNAGAQAYAARGYRNASERKLINNQKKKKRNPYE